MARRYVVFRVGLMGNARRWLDGRIIARLTVMTGFGICLPYWLPVGIIPWLWRRVGGGRWVIDIERVCRFLLVARVVVVTGIIKLADTLVIGQGLDIHRFRPLGIPVVVPLKPHLHLIHGVGG